MNARQARQRRDGLAQTLTISKSGPKFMLLTPWNDSWKLYYEADSTQNHWQA